jgi:Uma2 family endonuclease
MSINVQPVLPQPTTPKTGAVPHRFTLAEFSQAWKGFLHRTMVGAELLDGVIFEMPEDGYSTIRWNAALNRWLVASLGDTFVIVPDKTLKLAEYWAPKPDFYVFDAALNEDEVNATNVLLVIEVSDTTLNQDLRRKMSGYEKAGVRDLWVVDVNARSVIVHRLSDAGRYGAPQIVTFDEAVSARLIPGLTLKLSDLPRLS